MFIRPVLTKYKLSRIGRRIVDHVLNPESILEPAKIQMLRATSASDPIDCFKQISEILTSLRIESFQQGFYSYGDVRTDKNKEITENE